MSTVAVFIIINYDKQEYVFKINFLYTMHQKHKLKWLSRFKKNNNRNE